MRLLNTRTLEFGEFDDEDVPSFAVLSHVLRESEVSYLDWLRVQHHRKSNKHFLNTNPLEVEQCNEIQKRPGYSKIINFISALDRTTDRDGAPRIDWAHVYNVCVDRTSSAEISESINGNWSLLERSTICLCLLDDMLPVHSPLRCTPAGFQNADWFTRGWTLPELLAPPDLRFFDTDWKYLATRRILSDVISSTTRIEEGFLNGERPPRTATAAHRMAWASRRKTARPEDLAYCLVGLLDVSMSPLYGEGFTKAFRRLQEKFLRRSNDTSLLAWGFRGPAPGPHGGPLAKHPAQFTACRRVVHTTRNRAAEVRITNRGIWLTTAVFRPPGSSGPESQFVYVMIDCTFWSGQVLLPLIPISPSTSVDNEFWRPPCCVPIHLRQVLLPATLERREILIRSDMPVPALRLGLQVKGLDLGGWHMVLQETWPPNITTDGHLYLPISRNSKTETERRKSQLHWSLLRIWTHHQPVVVMIRHQPLKTQGPQQQSDQIASKSPPTTATSSTSDTAVLSPSPTIPSPTLVGGTAVKILAMDQLADGNPKVPQSLAEYFWTHPPNNETIERLFSMKSHVKYPEQVQAILRLPSGVSELLPASITPETSPVASPPPRVSPKFQQQRLSREQLMSKSSALHKWVVELRFNRKHGGVALDEVDLPVM